MFKNTDNATEQSDRGYKRQGSTVPQNISHLFSLKLTLGNIITWFDKIKVTFLGLKHLVGVILTHDCGGDRVTNSDISVLGLICRFM